MAETKMKVYVQFKSIVSCSAYLARHESPFKHVRSLAHSDVSNGHFCKKHFPSTPTVWPAAANFASSSSALLLEVLIPNKAGISATATNVRRAFRQKPPIIAKPSSALRKVDSETVSSSDCIFIEDVWTPKCPK